MYLQARDKLTRRPAKALQRQCNRLGLSDQDHASKRVACKKFKSRRNGNSDAMITAHGINRYNYRHSANPISRTAAVMLSAA